MLTYTNGQPVHIPDTPTRFEFTEEVAAIFDNMAVRSIPMYREAHALHVEMLMPVLSRDGAVVIDVGSSRGHFFREVCTQMHVDPKVGVPGMLAVAIDVSEPMLSRLSDEMPWVSTVVADATSLQESGVKADVICLNYLLQFIQKRTDRAKVVTWAYESMKPGGILILGNKLVVSDSFMEMFSDRYIRFRMNNGYSREEIDRKTRALAGSMWPMTSEALESLVYDCGFVDYAETTRWLQFSTALCVRG